jgi:methylmalonyl-CoA epimerase
MYHLDHVGIAVPNLEQSLLVYAKNFGFVASHRERVVEQGVDIAFISLPNSLVELIAPIDNTGPIARFLEKRGSGIHHICYRVKSIHAELERLKAEGVPLIDEVPRRGAHNSLVAFISPKACEGVLTELCERDVHAQSH